VRSVFALPVLLLASLTADAFGYRTHAQVCDAAYDSLPAAVQQHIDGLVGLSGKRTFGELCGWPDDVRKEDDFRHTGRWHYINVPRIARESPPHTATVMGVCFRRSIRCQRA
jgi:hypothetical protein